MPILGQKSGKIALVETELEQAARQYEAVRQKIVFQVREAYTQYVCTGEEFVLWRNDIVRYCLMRGHQYHGYLFKVYRYNSGSNNGLGMQQEDRIETETAAPRES